MSGRAAPIAVVLCAALAAGAGGAAADFAPGERVAHLEAPLPLVRALPAPAHYPASLLQPAFRERWDESTRRERGRDYESAAALRKSLATELRDERAPPLADRAGHPSRRGANPAGRDDPTQSAVCRGARLGEAGARSGPELRGMLPLRIRSQCAAAGAVRGAALASAVSGALRRPWKPASKYPPTWRDGPDESELGNLYYGAATFYRRLPRSRWFQWVAGVRGDPERAVTLGRRALSLAPDRIDFHVELGASLLCLAAERGDPEARAEGVRWLERATALPQRRPGDATDRERARLMLDDPDPRLWRLAGRLLAGRLEQVGWLLV